MMLVAAVGLVVGASPATSWAQSADGAYEPLDVPVRLLDTRPGGSTADGRLAGIGRPASGTVLEVPIAGRAGVGEASAVAVNLTAVDAAGPGFVTAHACGDRVPVASNLNFAGGDTVANLALVTLDDDGRLCLYVEGSAELLVDVAGRFAREGFLPLDAPVRLVDTRPGAPTVDGRFSGDGERPAGSTLTVPVAGRGGLGQAVPAAALNVTVTDPAEAGYVTVYPCDQRRPNASNLNHGAGRTIATAVIAGLSPAGEVCVHTSARTGVIVDVAGAIPTEGFTALPAPRRLLDTRGPASTFDGRDAGGGLRPAGGSYTLEVAGRAGVPTSASTVVLTVTAVDAERPGFVTAHPSGTARPNASNLNHGADEATATIANTVVARVGAGGAVCLFSSAPTEMVVDVAGWIPGPPPPPGPAECPAAPPEALAEQWTTLLARGQFVNAAITSGLTAAEVRAQFPTPDPPVGGDEVDLMRRYCWFAGGLCAPPTDIVPGAGSVDVQWAPEGRTLTIDVTDDGISYVLPPFSADQRRSPCAVFELGRQTRWTTTVAAPPDGGPPGVVWRGQPRPDAIPSGDVEMTWGPADEPPYWGETVLIGSHPGAGQEWLLFALDDGVQATTVASPPWGCGRYSVRTSATGGDPSAIEGFLDALRR